MKKLKNNSTKIERDKMGRLPKGAILNPTGRPKGSKNFTTDFEEAIKGIKDKDTGEQLTMGKIIKIGITKMLKGDAKFEGLYKDLLDRYYGKGVQPIDLSGEVKLESNEKIIEMQNMMLRFADEINNNENKR